jgi:hypothetical protein
MKGCLPNQEMGGRDIFRAVVLTYCRMGQDQGRATQTSCIQMGQAGVNDIVRRARKSVEIGVVIFLFWGLNLASIRPAAHPPIA